MPKNGRGGRKRLVRQELTADGHHLQGTWLSRPLSLEGMSFAPMTLQIFWRRSSAVCRSSVSMSA